MPPNSSFTDIKFDEDSETLTYKVNNQEYCDRDWETNLLISFSMTPLSIFFFF